MRPFPRPSAPARAGQPVADVDTPALLLDLDAVEANIATVHPRVLGAGLALRAHGKAHKCPELARLQIAAGAHGICCQKASEAEVFADAGIDDILITNEVIGATKVARVALLAGRVKLSICADDAAQVEQLAQAVTLAGTRLAVLVELDVGHERCGVPDADAVVALATRIAAHAPALSFGGIHAYRGSAQHMRDPAERAAAVDAAVAKVVDAKAALAAAGLPCPVVTGGGTGTYMLEAASPVYTEVQPGSYVLMDVDYARNTPAPGMAPLRHALHVWCSVISVHPGHAVLDGGLKAFAMDSGLPQIVEPGWSVKGLSDEHCVIVPGDGARPLAVGDKVRLIPGHCDPTVNLHDWLVAVRGDTVVDAWPVAARGALF